MAVRLIAPPGVSDAKNFRTREAFDQAIEAQLKMVGSVTVDVPNIAAGAMVSFTVSVSGAMADRGQTVQVGVPSTFNTGLVPWGYVSAAERADPLKHGKEFVDNEALRNYRFYAEFHTRLFPYIYTFAKESSTTGLPILRPLVLLHQDDPATFGINHVYYFGSELLVAPIVEPNKTARVVYLPKGRWVDFWTNERIDRSIAGQNHPWFNADRTKLPLFAREGAIIPMLAEVPQTLCDANYVNNDKIHTPSDGLLFRIYPADTSRFVVHDGTDITCRAPAGAVEVKITSPQPRPVQLTVLAAKPALGVRKDGTALIEKADPNDFANETSAWKHDSTTGFLEIKFPLAAGPTTITF